MKLIRIASSDQLTSLFSNEFSEAITLPPQSKIALLNGMFAVDSKSIFIPADTTISFSPKDGTGFGAPAPTVTATLPEGYYTQTSLLSTLTQAMNYALPQETMGTVCFAWNVAVKHNVVSLNFARSNSVAFKFPPSNMTKMTEHPGGTFTGDSITGTVPSGQFPGFAYTDVSVLPYNTDLELTPGNNNQHFIFGLLKHKPTASDTFLDVSYFMYGIKNDGTHLNYIVDGQVVDTEEIALINPAANGVIIKFNKGTVDFDDEQYTQSIPFSLDGYNLALCFRANGASVSGTSFNQNPFDSNTIENSSITRVEFPLPQTLHVDESLTLGRLDPTNVTVTMSDTMRAVLGFADNPTPIKALSSHFGAQNQLISSSTPTSITVECPNLGGLIESYDGISQKRRPIVAVIPAMEQANKMLTYQPGYPIFIDLNNRFPIQLSKLEVRLLSSFDDTEVNLDYPGTSLTFALDHSNPQKTTG